MKHDDNGVSAGYILFTLKAYNLGRPNTFIGEALIPMSELECVDSSDVLRVQNTYLKVTKPQQDPGKETFLKKAFMTDVKSDTFYKVATKVLSIFKS